MLAVGALLLGMRLQARTSPAQYRKYLNLSLVAMALLLLGQEGWRALAR